MKNDYWSKLIGEIPDHPVRTMLIVTLVSLVLYAVFAPRYHTGYVVADMMVWSVWYALGWVVLLFMLAPLFAVRKLRHAYKRLGPIHFFTSGVISMIVSLSTGYVAGLAVTRAGYRTLSIFVLLFVTLLFYGVTLYLMGISIFYIKKVKP